MNLNKRYLLAAFVSLFFLVSACDKEGPAGAQGPQGDPGPAGPQGPQGPAGSSDSNTISIVSSDWLEVEFTQDTVIAGIYRANIADTRLTTDFLLNNQVRVYINLGTNEEPMIASLPNEVGNIYIRHAVAPGNIMLSSNINASTYGDSAERKNLVKYFLISADVAARSHNVDMSNYMDVKRAFRLKD